MGAETNGIDLDGNIGVETVSMVTRKGLVLQRRRYEEDKENKSIVAGKGQACLAKKKRAGEEYEEEVKL